MDARSSMTAVTNNNIVNTVAVWKNCIRVLCNTQQFNTDLQRLMIPYISEKWALDTHCMFSYQHIPPPKKERGKKHTENLCRARYWRPLSRSSNTEKGK